MIAELGLALLWIAAALACLSLVAGTLFLRGGSKDLAGLVRPASVAQGVLTATAFGLVGEESGMVADGRMRADGTFVADRILAKHDERYMPPQMGDMPKNMKAPTGV